MRCRPLSEREHTHGHTTSCVRVDPWNGVVELMNPVNVSEPMKCFSFDRVYDHHSTQLDIYEQTVRPIVESVLQGFNGTVFAYGQTGTGKTYTMEGEGCGDKSLASSPEQRGVIPNAIEHIFQHIAQSPPHQQYLVRASYLEIYQEEIRDLLDKSGGAAKRLELKESPEVGVYVRDLSSFVTQCVEEIDHVLRVGHANRSVGQTNMNEHSSRSHAILIVTVECSETGPDDQSHIRVGRLNLVDLAGSERQSKTGSEGQRFREATKINLSLCALGNVIGALTDPQSAHIPYRDSKLTRLLQDSLGGNSKTVMIANIGPAAYNYEETLSTLRYSSRAKQIQNRPRINEDPKDALLRQFQEEIARLKALLEEHGTNRQRRTARKTTQTDGADHVDTAVENGECADAEEYLREQQHTLDAERERVLGSSEIVEEEKQRLLAALAQRELALEQERQQQRALTAKIRRMQSKLLSGHGGTLLERAQRREDRAHQKLAEQAEQRHRKREIAEKLEAQQLETAHIKQTFANMQQEMEAKRRKLHKLHNRLQQMRLQIRDNDAENALERQNLEHVVLELNKELALKWLIIENFVPPQIVQRVHEHAMFDENEFKWVLPHERQWQIHSHEEEQAQQQQQNAAVCEQQQQEQLQRLHRRSSTFLVEKACDDSDLEQLKLPVVRPIPIEVESQPMADSGLGSSANGSSQGRQSLTTSADETREALGENGNGIQIGMNELASRKPLASSSMASMSRSTFCSSPSTNPLPGSTKFSASSPFSSVQQHSALNTSRIPVPKTTTTNANGCGGKRGSSFPSSSTLDSATNGGRQMHSLMASDSSNKTCRTLTMMEPEYAGQDDDRHIGTKQMCTFTSTPSTSIINCFAPADQSMQNPKKQSKNLRARSVFNNSSSSSNIPFMKAAFAATMPVPTMVLVYQ